MKNVIFIIFAFLLITFASCNKDEGPTLTINQKEVNLKFDGSFQFSVENANNIEWSVDDDFIGQIDESGFFTAIHIGSTTVKAKTELGEVTAKVTISSYNTIIQEPHLRFGSSKVTIKGLEKRQLLGENENLLMFTDPSYTFVKQAGYLFENNSLVSAILLLYPQNENNTKELLRFYIERYWYAGITEDEMYVLFVDKDETYLVGISETEELGLHALYNPLPPKLNKTGSLKKEVYRFAPKDIVQLQKFR